MLGRWFRAPADLRGWPYYYAVGYSRQDGSLEQVLDRLQHVPSVKQLVLAHCSQSGSSVFRELPSILQDQLRDWQRHTWFRRFANPLGQGSQVSVSLAGTRPGLPLADLLFNLAAIYVLCVPSVRSALLPRPGSPTTVSARIACAQCHVPFATLPTASHASLSAITLPGFKVTTTAMQRRAGISHSATLLLIFKRRSL